VSIPHRRVPSSRPSVYAKSRRIEFGLIDFTDVYSGAVFMCCHAGISCDLLARGQICGCPHIWIALAAGEVAGGYARLVTDRGSSLAIRKTTAIAAEQWSVCIRPALIALGPAASGSAPPGARAGNGTVLAVVTSSTSVNGGSSLCE
jgi:hypothetical protein